MMSKPILFVFLCALLMGLVSCAEVPVAEDMTQEQARSVVAVLAQKGIEAQFSRKGRGRGKYSVEVPSKSFSQAVVILDAEGVPETSREQFLSTLSASAFLPNSQAVELLRVDFARAVQLEDLLESMPGVLSAKAIIQWSSTGIEDQLVTDRSDTELGSEKGVSIVLRVATGTELPRSEIEKLLGTILPHLETKQIYLSTHEETDESSAEDPSVVSVPLEGFLFGWRVAKADYLGLALSFLGTGLLFAIAGALGGYWYRFMTAPSLEDRSLFEGGHFPLEPMDIGGRTHQSHEEQVER